MPEHFPDKEPDEDDDWLSDDDVKWAEEALKRLKESEGKPKRSWKDIKKELDD